MDLGISSPTSPFPMGKGQGIPSRCHPDDFAFRSALITDISAASTEAE
jgi:hypothetical protein